MASDSTVKVNFIGDSSSLKHAADESDAHLSKLGDGIGRMAKAAAVGFLAVGVGVAAFSKSAVSAASDLSESLSKVNVVFGENAKDIEKWASTASTSMGMTKQAALEAAGTFGNFLIALGNPKDAAKDMSKAMVGLAADLASFNNTSSEEVLLALRAGLAGEAEPLRKFGVNLSAARIEAEGAAVGIKKLYKDMSGAEKSTLAYQVIMKDTALAQGDFARTSEGLANRTRILKARFGDIQAEIGTKMLPVVVRLAGFILDKVIPVFSRFANEAVLAVKLVVAGFTSLDRTSSGFHGKMEEIGIVARRVFDWMKENIPPVLKAIANGLEATFKFMMDHKEVMVGIAVAIGAGFVFWAVSAAAAAVATLAAIAPFIAAAVAIGALVAGVIYAYKHWGWFHDAVDKAWQIMQDVADWFTGTFIPFVKDDVIPVIAKIGTTIGDIAQKIAEITVKFWQFVVDVKEVVEDIGDAFREIGEKIWAPFKWAFEKIKEVYDKSIGPIIGAIRGVGDLFGMAGGTAGAGSTQFGSGPGGATVFGGARAMGGPVSAGRSYLVGERGPELFSPGRSGSISAGGGSVFIFEMNGREFARAIVDESTRSGGLPIRIRAAS